MHDEILLLKELSAKTCFARIPIFRETLWRLKDISLHDDDIRILVELYSLLKDISCRNYTLQTLVLKDNGHLKDFFLKAYKRERYLDMKLTAIRGYANYANEHEVEKLMSRFTELLIKRQETTPYNYQEYEQIRSIFGLPYLINKYKYQCFIDAFEQEEKQYNTMPKAFKGLFTLDEKGNYKKLMEPEQMKKKMEDFFHSQKINS